MAPGFEETPAAGCQVAEGGERRCCKIRLSSERHRAEFAPHQRRAEAAVDVGGLPGTACKPRRGASGGPRTCGKVAASARGVGRDVWTGGGRSAICFGEGQEVFVGASRGGPDHRVQGLHFAVREASGRVGRSASARVGISERRQSQVATSRGRSGAGQDVANSNQVAGVPPDWAAEVEQVNELQVQHLELQGSSKRQAIGVSTPMCRPGPRLQEDFVPMCNEDIVRWMQDRQDIHEATMAGSAQEVTRLCRVMGSAATEWSTPSMLPSMASNAVR